MNGIIKNNNVVEIQLSNLLLDLKKDTSVKGVHKQITDSIRSITQDYQKYTITKKMKLVFNSYNIQIPDVISQSERQYYSSLLKKTDYNRSALINNTFSNIEHFIEIKIIKDYLLNKWRVPGDKNKAIEELKEYFKENVRCFFKLTAADKNLVPGTDLNTIKEQLVCPEAIKMNI